MIFNNTDEKLFFTKLYTTLTRKTLIGVAGTSLFNLKFFLGILRGTAHSNSKQY